jgi:hypothetical protein
MEQMTPTEARAVLVGTQSSVAIDLPKADVTHRTITSDGQTVKLTVVDARNTTPKEDSNGTDSSSSSNVY